MSNSLKCSLVTRLKFKLLKEILRFLKAIAHHKKGDVFCSLKTFIVNIFFQSVITDKDS